MNWEIIAIFFGGAFGAALVGLFQFLIKRRDEKKAADSSERKALRYLMLYIIQERAMKHIAENVISLDDRRRLIHWHDLYHDGLNGNGDADALMNQVMHLQIKAD